LSVVLNGLDLEHFHNSPVADGQRARIVGIGSLNPRKRWERLLDAVSQLVQRGCAVTAQIVGDGPLRGSLQRRAQELGIAECVELTGHREDIPRALASATFLVHTSDNEGYPNAVMEAMACGRAVVATDAGDVPALVDDGQTGFVVPRGDDAALVARMVTLVTDRDLCRRMGRAGRAKAERHFGLDRLVSETLGAYRAMGWQDA
jgi:glycosyltransferase involved in cell wall biosynthesis